MPPAETQEADASSPALSLSLSPQGRLHVHVDVTAGADLASALAPIAKHFERGDGHGVFRLGAAEPETPLPGVLGFWRDVGRAFVVRLCATEDVETLRAKVDVEVPADELAALAAAAPPMMGGEYVTPTVLAELCGRMAAAVRDELAAWDGTVEAFLRQASPAWNLVGRVCFHLAENKSDPDAPFAFVATYTTRLSARAKAQHLPLGQALREYAGARNRQALLALLGPVQRAARASAVAKDLVDGGRRVRDAGVDSRGGASLPDRRAGAWRPPAWSCGCRRRGARSGRRVPRCSVTVGARAGQGRRRRCDPRLLDRCHPRRRARCPTRELRAILDGIDGLALVRGRWVEVDRERLRQVLERWQRLRAAHAAGGLSVSSKALRLLAGAPIADAGADAPAGAVADWSTGRGGRALAEETLGGPAKPRGAGGGGSGPRSARSCVPTSRRAALAVVAALAWASAAASRTTWGSARRSR